MSMLQKVISLMRIMLLFVGLLNISGLFASDEDFYRLQRTKSKGVYLPLTRIQRKKDETERLFNQRINGFRERQRRNVVKYRIETVLESKLSAYEKLKKTLPKMHKGIYDESEEESEDEDWFEREFGV